MEPLSALILPNTTKFPRKANLMNINLSNLNRVSIKFGCKCFLLCIRWNWKINNPPVSEASREVYWSQGQKNSPLSWVPLGVCDFVTLWPINPHLSQQPAMGLDRNFFRSSWAKSMSQFFKISNDSDQKNVNLGQLSAIFLSPIDGPIGH